MHDNNAFKKNQSSKDLLTPVNYGIRSYQVRVINRGNIVSSRDDAIKAAEAEDLDLVLISYDKSARIAICKVIDYGKFKYELSKKLKDAKKHARENAVTIKTILFSITTDDGDKERLIHQAQEFIKKGDKVKLTIRFRNKRESLNLGFAKDIMKQLLTFFDGIAVLDTNPTLNGKELSCILSPAK